MIIVGHNGPSQTVYVVADERGESETYEAFSLHCIDTRTNKLVWSEGIRKDRSQMIKSYRDAIESALTILGGK